MGWSRDTDSFLMRLLIDTDFDMAALKYKLCRRRDGEAD
jgi:hypothetical protein